MRDDTYCLNCGKPFDWHVAESFDMDGCAEWSPAPSNRKA